jgi:peptidoglycan/xylan/chitin deacetylase (PgdA/CDA1 family)
MRFPQQDSPGPMGSRQAFPLTARELNHWREQGRQAQLWLRDDDAHAPVPALDRLLGAMRRQQVPCLLAVVPLWTGEPLAIRLREEPLVKIAVHGLDHKNNAPKGARAEEMALELGMERIRHDLAQARHRLIALFGEAAGRWYVPPWNRISDGVANELGGLGFSCLSTFADRAFDRRDGLGVLNTHVDLIDWKAGRVGHATPVVDLKLAEALAKARRQGFRAVGILTHHLAHDEQVWSVLEKLLELGAEHPAAGWHDADDLLKSDGHEREEGSPG